MALPQHVVREDHKLEKAASSASEMLAELRWHWTLDETNPKRVAMREYARAVGRALSTIQASANGYVAWIANDRGTPVTEAINRERMSADREAAVGAVADARAVTFETARKTRPTEIKRVLDQARERVEKEGGTVEEHAKKTADWIVRAERAESRSREQRRRSLGLRFVEMEGKLAKAKSALVDALAVARDVEWEDEHRELLEHTLEGVKSLLALVDLALTGAADVDWDAELAGLEQTP